jgi:single-strand DNA-binding protein
MNNLNSVLLEGNLVRDPVLKQTTAGAMVCTFTIASNRYLKRDGGFEKETAYVDAEAWGKLAECCDNLGHKGRGVRVVGRLKQDRWTGNDGVNHSRLIIAAEHVEFRPEFAKADPRQDMDFSREETEAAAETV